MDISVKCCKQYAGKEENDDTLEREKRVNVMGVWPNSKGI